MTFPLVELKFSSIHRTPGATTILVRVYRVEDGRLNADGGQQYTRTLLRERTIPAPAGMAVPRIVATTKIRLLAWADEFGYALPDDQLICTL